MITAIVVAILAIDTVMALTCIGGARNDWGDEE